MKEPAATSNEPVVVGISVSEPAADELVRLGLSEMHVRHAFIELVRHVLARGDSIAYGGDLRTAGYTEALFDLVRTYDRKDISGPDRVLSFLAWPIWCDISSADRAALANVATLREIPRLPSAPESLPAAGARSPDDMIWASLALTDMRRQMTSAIGARVVLGGRLSGQLGLYPGVVEEALLGLGAEVPLYVAGGFGGCGRAIALALEGGVPTELSLDYQLERTPRYRELLAAATAMNLAPSFDDTVATFANAGINGLRNGLDERDNKRLFSSDDVDEVVALVLRGLRQVREVA